MLKNKIHSVVYQIWPRSFMDSNHDGIGDLQGIISKLDYLQNLGVDIIWLSPVYTSPNHDYGYDISDYYAINPEFGSMADMEELIEEAKKRNIDIIMDLVANHTSDQHEWFQEALKNKKSDKRDYYFFKEGKENKEPNNWISLFGGSAWTQHEDNLYSLNLFTPSQKDLNWENHKVRQEIYKIIDFWQRKGIKGFRMDVINLIAKKEGLPSYNAEKKGYQFAKDYIVSLDKSHAYIQEMYEKVLKSDEHLYVGEGVLINPLSASHYCGYQSHELDSMFHFDLALIGCGPLGKYDFRKLYKWTIREFKDIYFKWQIASVEKQFSLGNFLSNHDQPRAVSRFGDDQNYHDESSKCLLTLNFVSKGTPYLYQGEEIGMTNCAFEIDEWKDFEAINDYKVLKEMMHLPAFIAKKVIQKMTRDHARTPMQWRRDKYAGFSDVLPWIKVNPNTETINVETQMDDEYSILSYTKKLIQLYKSDSLFAFGNIEAVLYTHKQMLGIKRFDDKHAYLILMNLSNKYANFKCESEWLEMSLILTNLNNKAQLQEKMIFAPYEVRIYKSI